MKRILNLNFLENVLPYCWQILKNIGTAIQHALFIHLITIMLPQKRVLGLMRVQSCDQWLVALTIRRISISSIYSLFFKVKYLIRLLNSGVVLWFPSIFCCQLYILDFFCTCNNFGFQTWYNPSERVPPSHRAHVRHMMCNKRKGMSQSVLL